MNAIKKKDKMSKLVESVIREHFLPRLPGAKLDVYRAYASSIWIRIIHPSFGGKGIPERIEPIWAVITEHLPAEIISRISVCFLITPDEVETSGMNYEFEHPSASRL